MFLKDVRATLLLAGPVVAAQLGQMSMSFIDTLMVGRLGREALAGVALGNSLFFFIFVVSTGVLLAVGPIASHQVGAGAVEPIGRTVRQGFWLALFLAIPASIILWNAPLLLRLLGQEEVAIAGARDYLRAIMWGYLPALGTVVLRSFMEALGRPWPVTIITFFGVIVNVVANYTLMFGIPGLIPPLGLVGTGIASALVFTTIFLALTLYIRARADLRQYGIFQRIGRPDRERFGELVRIGWPIGITTGVESSLFMVTALMMGTIGTLPLAAHQIAIQCASFAFMIPLGIGIATSVRVGQAAGRMDPSGVRRAGVAGMTLAASAMIISAIVFWTIPETIVRLYLDPTVPENGPVIALAVSLLGVAAVFQFVDGLQVSAAGALRGLKDTRVPMVIATVSYLGIGVASGYVAAFVADLGAKGLWWGLVVGLSTAAALLVWRFAALTKRRAETVPA